MRKDSYSSAAKVRQIDNGFFAVSCERTSAGRDNCHAVSACEATCWYQPLERKMDKWRGNFNDEITQGRFVQDWKDVFQKYLHVIQLCKQDCQKVISNGTM